jgi:hypothetical protein
VAHGRNNATVDYMQGVNMFDKNEYWKKKQERKKISEGRSLFGRIRASAFFEGFFAKPDVAHDAEPSAKKGHTRSPKERRMRRQRHHDRLRAIRAL